MLLVAEDIWKGRTSTDEEAPDALRVVLAAPKSRNGVRNSLNDAICDVGVVDTDDNRTVTSTVTPYIRGLWPKLGR
jgi:hypothetical protein